MSDLIPSIPRPEAAVSVNELMSDDPSFLPRVQLLAATSKLAADAPELIGQFVFVKGSGHESLGKSFNAAVLTYRPKAMTFEPEVQEFFDTESPEFKDIKERSDARDSGCVWGIEYLLYVEGKGLATYYLSSKSARMNAVEPLYDRLEKFATISAEKVQNKKSQTWSVPKVTDCSTPFDIGEKETAVAQAQKFLNPPEPQAAVAADTEERER